MGYAPLTQPTFLAKNENGAILYSIKEEKTLNEIIDEVYSDALSNYGEESEKAAVRNKMIDEMIQSNPTLSKNINGEAKSYEELGDKKITADLAGSKMLNIPTAIVYQSYGDEVVRTEFYNSQKTYTPSSETASVVKGTEILFDDEYGSFEELIYGTYGEDISNEAYRDIAYAIVNSPSNSPEFEVVLDDMNFNELAQAGSINDVNRLNDTMIGLEMPVVTTLSSTAKNINVRGGNKDGIIFQLSPAAVNEGENDRVIEIKSNTDGILTSGEVMTLKDVVQYYSSPDGKGRFATVQDGKTVLNDRVNYVKEFASQIMQQVVYANLDIFTAEYEDKDGVHKYGLFDVNPDYDTNEKSIEEIISNSQINIQRMNNYSFVDENGNSKFDEGTELKLPQFNYRINTCEKLGMAIQKPVAQEPEVITPTDIEEPTETPTIAPTEVEDPTEAPTIAPTEVEDPTETPTIAPTQEEKPAPTPPEGSYVQSPDGNYYKVTSELDSSLFEFEGKFYDIPDYLKHYEAIYVYDNGDLEMLDPETGSKAMIPAEQIPNELEDGSVLKKGDDGKWYYVSPEAVPSETEDGFVLVKGEDGKLHYADPSEIDTPTTDPTDIEDPTIDPTDNEDPTTDPTTAPTPTPPEGSYVQSPDGNYYKVTSELDSSLFEFEGKFYDIPDYLKHYEAIYVYDNGDLEMLDPETGSKAMIPAEQIPNELEDGSVLKKGDDGKWYYVSPEAVPSETEDGFVLVKGEDGKSHYVDPSENDTPTTTPTDVEDPTTAPMTAPLGIEEPTTTPTVAPSGTQDPTTSTAPSMEDTPSTVPTDIEDLATVPTIAPTEVEESTTTPTVAPSGTQDPTTSTAPSMEDTPTTAPTNVEGTNIEVSTIPTENLEIDDIF